MEKELKNITGLTKIVGGSLPLLKNGIKRSAVLIETGKIGLIPVLDSTPLMWPLNLGLNPTSFLNGVDEW